MSLISTISPIMFMLSCTIVLKFSQGDYEATQWSGYNKAIKVFHVLLLSIAGIFSMIIIFFLDAIRKIFLPFLLFGGQNCYLQVDDKFLNAQAQVSGLTLSQFNQLTLSTKVSQLLFEDIP